MKIAVVGAGSLGCLYGGHLAASGQDVWLLHHREAHAEALQDRGIRIRGARKDEVASKAPITVNATTDAAEVGVADLVIILVKAHQTAQALDDHRGCIGPETIVMTLQNGLRNYDLLRDRFGDRRAVGGVAYQGGVMVEPGVVNQSSRGHSVIGGPNSDAVERVRHAFEVANLEIVSVDDPTSHIWNKQLVSLAIKPLAALTRLTNDGLVADDGLCEVMDAILTEASAIADAEGIDVDATGVVNELRETFGGESNGGHTSSMLQDVEASQKTEIDEINGAIVDIADEHGIDVPTNRALTELVRGLERSYGTRDGQG